MKPYKLIFINYNKEIQLAEVLNVNANNFDCKILKGKNKNETHCLNFDKECHIPTNEEFFNSLLFFKKNFPINQDGVLGELEGWFIDENEERLIINTNVQLRDKFGTVINHTFGNNFLMLSTNFKYPAITDKVIREAISLIKGEVDYNNKEYFKFNTLNEVLSFDKIYLYANNNQLSDYLETYLNNLNK